MRLNAEKIYNFSQIFLFKSMLHHPTQPKLSMFISESLHVVIPVQEEINRPVESSLKNLREQKI